MKRIRINMSGINRWSPHWQMLKPTDWCGWFNTLGKLFNDLHKIFYNENAKLLPAVAQKKQEGSKGCKAVRLTAHRRAQTRSTSTTTSYFWKPNCIKGFERPWSSFVQQCYFFPCSPLVITFIFSKFPTPRCSSAFIYSASRKLFFLIVISLALGSIRVTWHYAGLFFFIFYLHAGNVRNWVLNSRNGCNRFFYFALFFDKINKKKFPSLCSHSSICTILALIPRHHFGGNMCWWSYGILLN